MNTKIAIATLIISVISTSAFAQKVTIVTIDGVKYAAISSEGMPKGYETRDTTIGNANTSIYYKTKLYTYSETGQSPPADAVYLDPKYSWPVYVNGISGEIVKVKRVVRHYEGYKEKSYSFPNDTGIGVPSSYNPNTKISTLFAVAPTDICDDGEITSGNDISAKMMWASAAGFLISAHSIPYNTESSATQRGCYMYRGKNGTDPRGTWRLPVQRELILMGILKVPLQNTTAQTGLVPFYAEYYWSATEDSILGGNAKQAGVVQFSNVIESRTIFAYKASRVRCIRDILPTENVKK